MTDLFLLFKYLSYTRTLNQTELIKAFIPPTKTLSWYKIFIYLYICFALFLSTSFLYFSLFKQDIIVKEIINGTKCTVCNHLCPGFEPHLWRYVIFWFVFFFHLFIYHFRSKSGDSFVYNAIYFNFCHCALLCCIQLLLVYDILRYPSFLLHTIRSLIHSVFVQTCILLYYEIMNEAGRTRLIANKKKKV